MNDKERLELAAKAAGIALKPMQINNVTYQGDDRFIGYMTDCEQWPRGWFNPLTDDGDALRLAVKLGMDIDVCLHRCGVGGAHTEVNCQFRKFHKDTDPYAATRQAIVRAAAEIGRR